MRPARHAAPRVPPQGRQDLVDGRRGSPVDDLGRGWHRPAGVSSTRRPPAVVAPPRGPCAREAVGGDGLFGFFQGLLVASRSTGIFTPPKRTRLRPRGKR